MKILKMNVNRSCSKWNYNCVFDNIPELTYEKVGSDYVGSVIDEHGDIIFSQHLKRMPFGNAFAGRELSLNMKDGSIQKIKDHWFDLGYFKEHGAFIHIGANTVKNLQRCYVYFAHNINVDTFNKMLEDYYSREKEYEYYEIQKWVDMQYKWYPVVIDGERYPIVVNENGGFAKMETKEKIYPRRNLLRFYTKSGKKKSFKICIFEYEYWDNDRHRLVTVQRKMADVLRESLPISELKIKAIAKGGIS